MWWPYSHQTVNSGWPQDSLSSSGNRQGPWRSPPGPRAIVAGTSAENFVICRENLPVAAQSPGGDRQATAGWLYDIVQGQENRPTSYRSRKIGIRQKLSRHRRIYVFLGRRLYVSGVLLLSVYKYLFEQKCIRIFSHVHARKSIAHRVRSMASKQSRRMLFHFHILAESFLFVKIVFISYNSTFSGIRKTIYLPLSA